MATVNQAAELGSVRFPLLSTLVARQPQSSVSSTDTTSASKASTKPSLIYAENVMPTSWGFTSCRMDVVLPITDSTGNTMATNLAGALKLELINCVDANAQPYVLLLGVFSEPNTQYPEYTNVFIKAFTYNQGVVSGQEDYWIPVSFSDWDGTHTKLAIFTGIRFPVSELTITSATPTDATYVCVAATRVLDRDSSGLATSYEAKTTLLKGTNCFSPNATIAKVYFVGDPVTGNPYPAMVSMPATQQNSAVTVDQVVKAITTSQGQLVCCDSYTAYWSAVDNELDFLPNIASGAGSGIPTGSKGKIVTLGSITNGFAIYTVGNIIKAKATGNSNYPYLFMEADVASGVSTYEDVAVSQSNYVYTSEGLVTIGLGKDSSVNAEVTEFLSSKIYEVFNKATYNFEATQLVNSFDLKMLAVQDRYLVLSYKPKTQAHFDYALILDLVLVKWGKIKYPHLATCIMPFDTEGELRSYSDFANQDGSGLPYSAFQSINAATIRDGTAHPNARNNRLLAFLGVDGDLAVLDSSYSTNSFNSLAVVGKFQTSNSNLSTVTELIVDGATPFTKVTLLSSYSGGSSTDRVSNTTLAKAIPDIPTGSTAKYLCRTSARTFNVLLEGAFHLTYLNAVLEVAGRS